jgi:hypothetical protein
MAAAAALSLSILAGCGSSTPTYDVANLQPVPFGNTTIKVDSTWVKHADGETGAYYTDYKDPSKTTDADPVNAQVNLLTQQWRTEPMTEEEYRAIWEAAEASMQSTVVDPIVNNFCKVGTGEIGELTLVNNADWVASFTDCEAAQQVGAGATKLSGSLEIMMEKDGLLYIYVEIGESAVMSQNTEYFAEVSNSFDYATIGLEHSLIQSA